MLTLLTYASKNGLRQQIEDLVGQDKSLKLVTPFPAKADALRHNWSDRKNVDVITLSRFMQDFFSLIEDKIEAPLRKSRLLLKLNSFRFFLPGFEDIDYGTFKTAYQIFSDLRAYTDAAEFPDEILESFDENVATLAQLFHQACKRNGVLDEHAGVFELNARLRSPEGEKLKINTVIIFEGFTFITPAQLSLFEALAIRHEVLVPIPESVFNSSHAFDWTKSLELSCHEVIRAQETPKKEIQLAGHLYPQGCLSEAMRKWESEHQGAKSIILGTKNITEEMYQVIPFADVSVKKPIDITFEARDKIFDLWEKRIRRSKVTLSGPTILEWIEQGKKEIIEKKDLSLMKDLSIYLVLERALTESEKCLDQQPCDLFLLSLLKEVCSLDAPRNSQISILKNESDTKILSLKNLTNLDFNVPTLICLDSSFGSIKSDHRPFSPEMERNLAKLGPVRRPELEFNFLLSELNELWGHENLSIYIENELLTHDLGWKRVFEDVHLNLESIRMNTSYLSSNYNFFQVQLSAPPKTGIISASKLQDYLDCPRRYYAQRVERIVPRIETTLEIDPMMIGTVEHNLVRWAWENKIPYTDSKSLTLEATKQIDLKNSTGRLTASLRSSAINEAVLYATNGLKRLVSLEKTIKGIQFIFEREITSDSKTGFIDCLGLSDEALVLLDFKRSKGQNPSLGKWEEFSKIQLWFYLKALKDEGLISHKTKLAVGYLFFKDIEDSWLACEPSLQSQIEIDCPGWAKEWIDFDTSLQRYELFESETINKLANDTTFIPSPSKPDICTMCSLRPICPRLVEEEESE
ncbi:MAG: PD-(D/E)XK nuclease family protein [Bacteriovoracaceae bacterium]|nr:PD-(D/E)XK nuclease family protein [Bacteriovoracaceae bacterium]